MSAIDSGVNPEHIGVSRAVSDCQIFKLGSGGSSSVPGLARCHLAVTVITVITGGHGDHGSHGGSREVTGVTGGHGSHGGSREGRDRQVANGF